MFIERLHAGIWKYDFPYTGIFVLLRVSQDYIKCNIHD